METFQIFDGGDVDEKCHFIEVKWVAHGQKISILKHLCKINDLIKNLMGAMLMKIVILSRENESHITKNLVKIWITK